jgi:hypothetical protein
LREAYQHREFPIRDGGQTHSSVPRTDAIDPGLLMVVPSSCLAHPLIFRVSVMAAGGPV